MGGCHSSKSADGVAATVDQKNSASQQQQQQPLHIEVQPVPSSIADPNAPQQSPKDGFQPAAAASPSSTNEHLQVISQMHQLTQTNLQLLDKLHASDARCEALRLENTTLVNELASVRHEATLDPRLRLALEHRRDPSARTLPADAKVTRMAMEQEIAHSNELQSVLNEHKLKLHDAQQRTDELELEHSKLLLKFGETQSLLFTTQREHRELTDSHHALQTAHSSCGDVLARAQQENQVSIDFASELREHLQQLESKQSADSLSTREAMTKLQQDVLTSQGELHHLKQEASAKDELIDELHVQLTSSRAKLEEARSLNTATQTRDQQVIDELRRMVEDAQRTVALSRRGSRSASKRSSLQKPLLDTDTDLAAALVTAAANEAAPSVHHSRTSSFAVQQPVVSDGEPVAHSLTTSLDGDVEFEKWLAAKRAKEAAAGAHEDQQQSGTEVPAIAASPAATTLTTPLDTASTIPPAVDPSVAFPTQESEAEFHAWLAEQQRIEQEALATATAAAQARSRPVSAVHAAAATTGVRPVSAGQALSKEGEAEFAAWLAKQPVSPTAATAQPEVHSSPVKPLGAAQPHLQLRDLDAVESSSKSHRSNAPSWPNFQPMSDFSPPAVSSSNTSVPQQQRRAWNDGPANAAEVNEQIRQASLSNKPINNSGGARRVIQPAPAAQSTLLSKKQEEWTESKDASAASSSFAPFVAATASLPPNDASSPTKVSYALWQSHHASTPNPHTAGMHAAFDAASTASFGASATASPSSIVDAAAASLLGPLDFLTVAPVLWLRGDSFLSSDIADSALFLSHDSETAVRHVAGWLDSSPHANHATVCSATNRSTLQERYAPLNDAAIVELGGGTAMKLARRIVLQQFTLFAVSKVTGKFPYVLGGAHGTYLPSFSSAASAVLSTRKQASTVSDSRSGASGFSVACFVRGPTVTRAYMHGHDVTTSGGARDASDIAIEYLGQTVDEGGVSLSSPASIAEIILIPTAVDETERLRIEQYLSIKYGYTRKG